MTAVAKFEGGIVVANDNASGLPALVQRAASQLASATTAAEVLEAKASAGLAYDAAKAAGRFAKAKGAFDDVMAAVYRAQADALEIEAMAKRRLADEYDAAQDRGEVRGSGINQFAASKTEAASAADIGLTHKDIHEARQVRDAEVANPGIIKATLDALVEAGEEPTKAALNREINGRLASYSGDNEWYTPAKYVELARTVMGRIDVDPASNDHAQQTVKAAAYYTVDTNGLDKDWRGTVWMNPPYSHPEIQQFTDKVLAELASGNVTEAIVLTNNSGDTGWHHALALASAARCVTRGRIRFESLTRQSGAGAMGQVFFYFGDDVERFADVFCEIGRIEVNGSTLEEREETPSGSDLKVKYERLQEKLKEQASIINSRDDMVAIAERQSQAAYTRAMFAEADKERLAGQLASLQEEIELLRNGGDAVDTEQILLDAYYSNAEAWLDHLGRDEQSVTWSYQVAAHNAFVREQIGFADILMIMNHEAFGRLNDHFSNACSESDRSVSEPRWRQHSRAMSEKISAINSGDQSTITGSTDTFDGAPIPRTPEIDIEAA